MKDEARGGWRREPPLNYGRRGRGEYGRRGSRILRWGVFVVATGVLVCCVVSMRWPLGSHGISGGERGVIASVEGGSFAVRNFDFSAGVVLAEVRRFGVPGVFFTVMTNVGTQVWVKLPFVCVAWVCSVAWLLSGRKQKGR